MRSQFLLLPTLQLCEIKKLIIFLRNLSLLKWEIFFITELNRYSSNTAIGEYLLAQKFLGSLYTPNIL